MDRATGISAVTLDVHGVLLLPDPAVLRQALEPFGAEPDNEACWRAHFEMIHLIDQTAEPDWPGIHRAMAGALGVPPERQVDAAPAALDTYLAKQWVAAPGAADTLARLESSGYSLAVIANSSHGKVEEWLADAGLCGTSGSLPRVACVLDSQLLGFGKPDRRIFELALSALDTLPSQCAHVGDSLASDVRGRRPLGRVAAVVVRAPPIVLPAGATRGSPGPQSHSGADPTSSCRHWSPLRLASGFCPKWACGPP